MTVHVYSISIDKSQLLGIHFGAGCFSLVMGCDRLRSANSCCFGYEAEYLKVPSAVERGRPHGVAGQHRCGAEHLTVQFPHTSSDRRGPSAMLLRLKDFLEPPEPANPAWFQRRGRSFERVLKQMFELEGMRPRASMRPSGEEIDGSFAMDDRFFLLEAKWHTPPIAASALYAFKGKVDGKLVGTIGAFFSMSDYSAEAVDALLSGKELNLILFGREDLLLIEDKQISMREALRVKLRYAAEYGRPFFGLATHLDEQARLGEEASIPKPQREWTIIVEGVDDVRTIQELLARFVIPAKVTVFPAGGQLSVAPLAVHLRSTGNLHVAAFVTPIPNADAQQEHMQEHMQELQHSGATLVVLQHSLEDWLGNYVGVEYYNACMMLSGYAGKVARRFARAADLDQLLIGTPSFAALLEQLEARPKE
ncbi:restriction endonuclease [Comamonas sp. A7-5]|uniref:restriction endonuclease n=1 Tax=Comamonas sp. A7-5 TaxID=673549 RepID=UPI0031D67733